MSHHEQGNDGGDTVNPIQVQKFLSGVDYPVDKQTIVDTAKEQGADDRVLSVLQQLPDEQFESPADVSKGIGQVNNG